MANKILMMIILLIITFALNAQMPVQQVQEVWVDDIMFEDEQTLGLDLPLFERHTEHDILSPRGYEMIHYRVEEDDLLFPFQRRLIGDVLSKRMSFIEEDYETLRNDVWHRTRLMNIDTQGRPEELASLWYAYWRLFNSWESYIERYILEENLNMRSPQLPKYIANAPDEEFDPDTIRRQATMPGGMMMDPMMGMPGGGMQPTQTARTDPRRRDREEEMTLPPVSRDEVISLIEELGTSHREQLQRILGEENRLEQAYQALIAVQKARIETYNNWKSEETIELLHYLNEHTGLINFEYEE